MPLALQTSQTPLPLDPGALLARWPAAAGLVVLWSGRPGRRRLTVGRPEGWILPETLAELDQTWMSARQDGVLLAGVVSYELGRRLEPAAGVGPRERAAGAADSARGAEAGAEAAWPLMAFARCREWAVWEEQGSGEGVGGVGGVRGMWRGPLDLPGFLRGRAQEALPGGFAVGPLRSRTGRERYQREVAWIIERIRAGDVYQVNLAHQLAGSFRGSARALFARLAAAADPWHGAYLELPEMQPGAGRRAVCSVSPELFLEYEPQSRRVTTRPMKGTRPGGADPGELALALKDTAELNMIIDLMRNDLGRSCAFGSVRVEVARAIERHGAGAVGGVLQATGEVSGVLRPEVSFLEALGRAFPPGSVTGAPKIQAMRMIESLEPAGRGPYCGSVCELRPDGAAVCSVAIRTALVSGDGPGDRPDWFERGELRWSVGAGIVADSDPAAEWQETLDKAQILVAAAETRIDD